MEALTGYQNGFFLPTDVQVCY